MPEAGIIVRPDGVDARLIPPGVADARARAFTAVLAQALDAVPLGRFDLVDVAAVDSRLLPALVRGLSMEEFVTEDMPERIVRRLLAQAIPLHVGKGRDRAVLDALAALEMDGTIAQWWRQAPPGSPNTNVTTVRIVDGWRPDQPASDPALRRAAARAIAATSRWSQSSDVRVRIAAPGSVRAGAGCRMGGTIRIRALAPDTSLPASRTGTLATARIGGTFRIRRAA